MLFDPVLIETLVQGTPFWLVVFLILVSFLGSAILLTPLFSGLYTLRPSATALTWVGILFGAYTVRSLAKATNEIGRPVARPDIDPGMLPEFLAGVYLHPVDVATTSFPSGHMVAAVVIWGLLAIDLQMWTKRTRVAVASTIVLLVGLSRVLLGAHWIEDVVVGALLGLVYLLAMVWIRDQSDNPVRAVFVAVATLALIRLSVGPSDSALLALALSVGVLGGLWITTHSSLSPNFEVELTNPRPVLGISGIGLLGVGSAVLISGSNDLLMIVFLGAGAVLWGHLRRGNGWDESIE